MKKTIDELSIDGESLFKEYPPIWHDDNKLIVFEIAKSSDRNHQVKIKSRIMVSEK